MKNLEKILELMEEDFTKDEQKQMTDDTLLFIDLFGIYDRMSPRGKRTTVQTLFIELINEMEVKSKC